MKEIIVENLIRKHLTENGWTVAPRKRQGIDIEATKENRTAVIEAKGIGAHSTAMTNNFYSVLGQILKDMTYSSTEYYVAFPEIEPYIRLWNNLPKLAKKRVKLHVIWVNNNGNVKGI